MTIQKALSECGPGEEDFAGLLEAVGVEGFLAVADAEWVNRLKPAGSGPCLAICVGETGNRPPSVGRLF